MNSSIFADSLSISLCVLEREEISDFVFFFLHKMMKVAICEHLRWIIIIITINTSRKGKSVHANLNAVISKNKFAIQRHAFLQTCV